MLLKEEKNHETHEKHEKKTKEKINPADQPAAGRCSNP
jgi:hypothetical protein